MSGYTRQSAATIIPNATITSAGHNNEYNALQAAFDAATGHKHDGSVGEGAPIPPAGLTAAQDWSAAGGNNPKTLTIQDGNKFNLVNQADNTKIGVFSLASLTSGSTRTYTLPDISDTLLALTATQSPTNKTFDNTNQVTLKQSKFTLQDATDVTKQAIFSLASIATATTRTYTLPDISDTLVTLTATQTLTNKTLTSPAINTATIVGGTINNSVIGGTTPVAGTFTTLHATGAGTFDTTLGVTGAVTLSGGGTLAGTFSGGTLSATTLSGNPTITVQANHLSIVDQTDATKIAQFSAASITTANTRTYTLPDLSDTLVTLTATQTLTNKTLTSPHIATIVNTGTLTLPTSTDTLVGRATTDTLSNKTLTAPTINNGTQNSPVITTPTITTPTINSGGTFNGSCDFTGQTYAPEVGLPASSGTVTIDLSTGTNFAGVITGNITLANPTNTQVGQSGVIRFTQGAGGLIISYGTNWKFQGGVKPTLTGTNGAQDALTYYVASSTFIIASMVNNLA